MKKTMATVVVALFMVFSMSTLALMADTDSFLHKNAILKQMSAYCRNTNESTSIVALNTFRAIFFRSNDLEIDGNIPNRTGTSTFRDLNDKMNADVDRIYTGVINFESSLKIANLTEASDVSLIELMKYLLVSEINILLKDQSYFTSREKIRNDIDLGRRFISSSMYVPSCDGMISDLTMIDKLANLMDLADYIYTEQLKWLMTTSYSLQNFNIQSMPINDSATTNVFAITPPPRMYIPNINDK